MGEGVGIVTAVAFVIIEIIRVRVPLPNARGYSASILSPWLGGLEMTKNSTGAFDRLLARCLAFGPTTTAWPAETTVELEALYIVSSPRRT